MCFEKGDKVRYVPYHAFGIRSHPDCENGIVSSVRDGTIFVKFDRVVKNIGWNEACAQGCRPDQLIKLVTG
jgi:hypothetical protein